MNDPPQCFGPVISPCDWADLQALDDKINALLPPQYQNCYDAVKPVSMGTAGLVYGPDGKVAWDQIWTSFCDLALAGGPPHRGKLLEPAQPRKRLAAREAYQAVVAEISRGVWLVTQMPVLPHQEPGWVGVRCQSARDGKLAGTRHHGRERLGALPARFPLLAREPSLSARQGNQERRHRRCQDLSLLGIPHAREPVDQWPDGKLGSERFFGAGASMGSIR